MKTLVVGGSGFVGSRLLSQVNTESFVNLDKNPSPFFNDITHIGDIRDLEKCGDLFSQTDRVILLAAEHRDDVSPIDLYYDVNVKGTSNVLKMMDRYKIKSLIFTSSVAVYGLNKINPDENHPLDPFNHYGKSKLKAEEVIRNWYEEEPEKKSVTIIRPTVIFGERNRGNVFNLLKQISNGNFVMVGKGLNKKSMAYVGNIVALILFVVKRNKVGYEVYNYADKPDLNMNELIAQIGKSLNKKIPSIKIPYLVGYLLGLFFDLFAFISKKKLSVSSVRIKKFCATTQFDSTKVMNEFSAPYSLNDGLDSTLKFEFNNDKKDGVVFYTE